MAKRLIRLFGFATHDAPGEAEAECALLEQQGIVDAVLSEDVDTIMFGCRRTLRNWSSEGTKGSKTPTHVSMYDAAAVAAGASGLDREGMVLVALMSGGDYLPEGVPGCGVKVACEAAKAGFGRDLCRIKRADRDALAAWKARMLHELRTNESGFFRTKHRALDIPESFPNMEVLGYYTHPVVSRQTTVDRLRREFPPARGVDAVGLREFAGETFDWAFRNGAVKLIRVLAPSLLVQRFLDRSASADSQHDDLVLKQKQEEKLVKAISSKRAHFSTDATPELRVSFIPADIVKLDLGAEPEEEAEGFGRNGIALNSDDEFDEEAAELGDEQPKAGSKKPFDPLQSDLAWIPEMLAKLGVPLTVEDWEGKQRMKEHRVAAKATRKTKTRATDMPVGALDKYVKVTKSVTMFKDPIGVGPGPSSPSISSQCRLPAPRGRSKQLTKSSATQPSRPATHVNPWTLASATSSSSQAPKSGANNEPIIISSSPVGPASPSPSNPALKAHQITPTKRSHGPLVNDLLSPAPLFTLPKPAEKTESAAQPKQPARKARPFKRVKSGADNDTGTQSTIKDFGRVLKNTSSPRANTKADTPPVVLVSDDDDDDDFPLPRFKPPPRSPLDRNKPVSRASSRGISEDPFGPPPAPPRTRGPPKAVAPRSAPETETDRQHEHPAADGSRHAPRGRDTNQTIGPRKSTATAAAPRSATTKVYIPQQNRAGLGYFTELEVSREEAELLTAAHASPGPGLGLELGKGRKQSRRAWRRSEIEILDLTGDD